MRRGAELGRTLPRIPLPGGVGTLLRTSQGTSIQTPINLGPTGDLENGPIQRVSALDAFKDGQQIQFKLTVYNAVIPAGPPPLFPSWISSVRLKPWFLRQGDEFRAPGFNGWTGNDQLQFGGGTEDNNRACWFPVPKMIDISEWQAVNPPPPAPPRHSDSIFVDDVWKLYLQDPNSPAYQATLLPGQTRLGRSSTFLYISHGYALGFTHSFEIGGQGGPPLDLEIDITWQTGTL